MILDRVAVDHADATVRLGVARALPGGFDRHDACWARAVQALIALSGDSDAEVRDWACFGLGQVGASSAAARDALARRLKDPDDDARCEALRALAATGDDRALTAVGERLAADDSDDIYRLELEAAAELADPTLYPLLMGVEDDWRGDDDDLMPVLAFAIKRCRPAARSEAEKVGRALVARVNELLADEPLAANLTASVSGQYPRTILTVLGPRSAKVAGLEVGVWDEHPLMRRRPFDFSAHASRAATDHGVSRRIYRICRDPSGSADGRMQPFTEAAPGEADCMQDGAMTDQEDARSTLSVSMVVEFGDIPVVGSRQYWSREMTSRAIPRVGDEVSLPGASAMPVSRVIWSPDLCSVDVVVSAVTRDLIVNTQATFYDVPEEVDQLVQFIEAGPLADLMEKDGWSLQGPRTAVDVDS